MKAKRTLKTGRANLTIPLELLERWDKVTKTYHISRSVMIREFLEEVLPIMEETDPNKIIKKGVLRVSESLKEIGDSIESK